MALAETGQRHPAEAEYLCDLAWLMMGYLTFHIIPLRPSIAQLHAAPSRKAGCSPVIFAYLWLMFAYVCFSLAREKIVITTLFYIWLSQHLFSVNVRSIVKEESPFHWG
jgi:hypothetical protein